MILGEYLKKKRKERKLNILDISENLGVAVSLISRIEKGTRSVNKDLWERYCNLLEIELKTFERIVVLDNIIKRHGDNLVVLEDVLPMVQEYIDNKKGKDGKTKKAKK